MKNKHVYLGRFAPFQNGHIRLTKKLIEQVGTENVLVLVGSSNTLNHRTPYTFEDRKKIIEVSFPDLEILPLPDSKADLIYFDGSTNDIWLDSIEKMASERSEKFVFYGGSTQDLEVLAQRFETNILVDRHAPSEKMSATQVRELIKAGKTEEITKLVDTNAIELIINKYQNL